ncbi:MAG: M28 family peptidase [Betaproteobacteria bacterium]
MRSIAALIVATGAAAGAVALAGAGQPQPAPAPDGGAAATLVARLDLARYRDMVRGLTAFGDRRQGTKRNQDAVDWIEARLKSFGYTNTARLRYEFPPATRGCGPSVPAPTTPPSGVRRRRPAPTPGVGSPTPTGGAVGRGPSNVGGSVMFGSIAHTGVNCDPMKQPDAAIRALDSEPVIVNWAEDVYATKIGTTHPDEMYIIGGHMDGHGYNQAANDDGSGTALVLELARVFASPDVRTERSIRFVLWNGEEEGLFGSRAYVQQRAALQGRQDPPGSGRYPEPKWLGMIQHDMMMWDHGMPRPDGTLSPDQRPEADVNIEFQSTAKLADAAQKLAWLFKAANEKYATDYPAQVGPHMTNTDSDPFKDLVPAISLRENERGAQIGAGWDPNWHQPTDVFTTYSDKDFRLGLNAAQTTAAALAELTGASVK